MLSFHRDISDNQLVRVVHDESVVGDPELVMDLFVPLFPPSDTLTIFPPFEHVRFLQQSGPQLPELVDDQVRDLCARDT